LACVERRQSEARPQQRFYVCATAGLQAGFLTLCTVRTCITNGNNCLVFPLERTTVSFIDTKAESILTSDPTDIRPRTPELQNRKAFLWVMLSLYNRKVCIAPSTLHALQTHPSIAKKQPQRCNLAPRLFLGREQDAFNTRCNIASGLC
jgi:hypothetical protein